MPAGQVHEEHEPLLQLLLPDPYRPAVQSQQLLEQLPLLQLLQLLLEHCPLLHDCAPPTRTSSTAMASRMPHIMSPRLAWIPDAPPHSSTHTTKINTPPLLGHHRAQQHRTPLCLPD